MVIRSLLVALAVVTAGLSAAPAADARPPFGPNWAMPNQESRPQRRDEARVMPVRDVIQAVRAQRGGALIDVLQFQDGSPPVYILRWRFDDGRIADLRVNAVNGRVIGGG